MANFRILLVEDDRMMLELFKFSLQKIGHTVVGSAMNGNDAIRLTEALEPEIILMDINLEGAIDGVDTATIIWEKFEAPIIFITGTLERQFVERAKKAEPYGYLAKPFQEIDLENAIELAHSRHQIKLELKRKHAELTDAYDEISRQRAELFAIHKDIISSIRYSRRLQDALLPKLMQLKDSFEQSFLFHIPRDIVSGDFFWCYSTPEKEYFAVVDCTGHGIPGAMLSVMGNDLLHRIMDENKEISTGAILNELNLRVQRALDYSTEEGDIRDGMDISVCSINRNTLELQFSGAYRPLLLFRNNELTILKGDIYPIGRYNADVPEFTTETVQLQKNDMLYMFSDGYHDQFGGDFGKKYKSSNFKNLLATISNLSIEQQHEKLKIEFFAWKKEFEQVDDVTVFGLRI